MTLLNETDILSQYLEKEVRKRWEKREGGGYCPRRQEEKSDCGEVQVDRLPVLGTPDIAHRPRL